MDCDISYEELAALTVGDLDGARAAIVERHGLTRNALFIVLQLMFFNQSLSDLAVDLCALQNAQGQLLLDRLTFGILGAQQHFKGLTGHVDRTDRLERKRKPLSRQEEIDGALHSALGQRNHQWQHLAFQEVTCG